MYIGKSLFIIQKCLCLIEKSNYPSVIRNQLLLTFTYSYSYLLSITFSSFIPCHRYHREHHRAHGRQRRIRPHGTGQGGRISEPVPPQSDDPTAHCRDIGSNHYRNHRIQAEKLDQVLETAGTVVFRFRFDFF